MVIIHVYVHFPDEHDSERELPAGSWPPAISETLHFSGANYEGLEGPWFVSRRHMEWHGQYVQQIHCWLEPV